MTRTLTWTLALVLAATAALGSRRGQEPRVNLQLESREVFTGEAYRLTLEAAADGFVYVYSLDPDGYVNLLFPVLAEDGRGGVRAGDRLVLDPLYAGATPGIEQVVAVHTREHRPIRASRHHFLAPDPQDLPDVHARLTRSERELDNYDTAMLTVLATGVPEDLSEDGDDDREGGDTHVGITIHSHVYDYWCPFCDCWHPSCSWGHCWCGWEVVHHYHHHTHFGHCFLWGDCHAWWRPPVIYIYVEGGSPWDYDTRPWRPRRVWGANRHFSDRWRHEEAPRAGDADRDRWARLPERRPDDLPDWKSVRARLEPEVKPEPVKAAPSILSTEQLLPEGREAGAAPSVLSTRSKQDGDPGLRRETPATPGKSGPLSKGKSKAKAKRAKPAGKGGQAADTEKKPDKPKQPDAKPDKPDKPEAKPGKPDEPEDKPDKPKPRKESPGAGTRGRNTLTTPRA